MEDTPIESNVIFTMLLTQQILEQAQIALQQEAIASEDTIHILRENFYT